MKRYGAICLKYFRRILKEIFRFCLVAIISGLIGMFFLILLAHISNNLFCGLCIDIRYPQISTYLGCLWMILAIIFFISKKWAWGIDFLIILLMTLFLVPYALGINMNIFGIRIDTQTHVEYEDTLTSPSYN